MTHLHTDTLFDLWTKSAGNTGGLARMTSVEVTGPRPMTVPMLLVQSALEANPSLRAVVLSMSEDFIPEPTFSLPGCTQRLTIIRNLFRSSLAVYQFVHLLLQQPRDTSLLLVIDSSYCDEADSNTLSPILHAALNQRKLFKELVTGQHPHLYTISVHRTHIASPTTNWDEENRQLWRITGSEGNSFEVKLDQKPDIPPINVRWSPAATMRMTSGDHLSLLAEEYLLDRPEVGAYLNDTRPQNILASLLWLKDNVAEYRDLRLTDEPFQKALRKYNGTLRTSAGSVGRVTSETPYWPLDAIIQHYKLLEPMHV